LKIKGQPILPGSSKETWPNQGRSKDKEEEKRGDGPFSQSHFLSFWERHFPG
jgi:hypothetical protein